ncbi:MAG TPA: heparan-alpha-glucosaminide N-acetyltransferase domain-containing protein [Burkholderiaceae bacterium]
MQIQNRIQSIDALRGLTVAAMLVVNDAGDWGHVYSWLEHADWFGCTLADFIFPFFMLIVGVSMSLALGAQIDKGENPAELSRAVLLRGLRIFLLGIALHYVAHLLLPGREFRLLGVLQRIGISFALVGLLAIHVRSARIQWGIFCAILLGYWALLSSYGSLEPDRNLCDRIDSLLLGRLAYAYDPVTGLAHDPEGILSTLPSLATVILGVRAGAWLREGKEGTLLLAGAIVVAIACAWSLVLPLNKQLWTSSFVLWTGGFGLLAIAATHELIDKRGFPAWGRSLGINAIAAYAGSWLATCILNGSGIMSPLYAHAFSEPLAAFGPFVPSLAFALAFSGAFWVAMHVMLKRGWRISI